MTKLFHLTSALWILLCAEAASSQAPSPPNQAVSEAALAGMERFIEEALKAHNAPGLSISIVKDGKVVLARGYGTRDPASGAPMTEDTIVPIGSLSKAFTSFGIGLLVDDGKLDLDAPASTYLPQLRLKDPLASAELSLRDMLSHRTGLPRHDFVWIRNSSLTRDALLERLPHLEPSAPFRTRYQYNNIMYMLAGLTIDRLAGQPWERFTTERIFGPLAMARTTLSPETALADPDRATGTMMHRGTRIDIPTFRTFPLINSAGGIYSTAEDLARWMIVHLSRGSIEGKKIIQPATLNQLHRSAIVYTQPDHPEVITSGYGLAWTNGTYRGRPITFHGGNLPGISSLITLVPSASLGITVLTNQGSSRLHQALTRTLLDRFLNLEPMDWSGDALKLKLAAERTESSARSDKAAQKTSVAKPSQRLSDYAGIYKHPGYGTVSVSQNGTSLVANYNDDTSALRPTHHEVFEATTSEAGNVLSDARLQFVRDIDGRVSGISVPWEPQVAPVLYSKQPDVRLSDTSYLKTLTGTYFSEEGKLVVSLDGNRLRIAPAQGAPILLVPSLAGEFAHPTRKDLRYYFETDKSGNIVALATAAPIGTTRAKRLP